ncbi:MAG: hypothetical protein IPL19_13345 [Sandaracinaceae bacterium]|nr:hypothetical protein [Sandaracinaceae bacterium]
MGSDFLIGSFNEPTCGANLVPGRNYRLRTSVGWPVSTVNANLYIGDNNNCQISLDLRNLDISAVDMTPDRLRVDVGIHARSVNAAGTVTPFPVRGFGIVPNCTIGINTTNGSTPPSTSAPRSPSRSRPRALAPGTVSSSCSPRASWVRASSRRTWPSAAAASSGRSSACSRASSTAPSR